MLVNRVSLEEVIALSAQRYNPPVMTSDAEESAFQDEIRCVYWQVLESLSRYGQEGDYFGTCDFAVRPDLKDRPTVRVPPAPPQREFAIIVLTPEFYQTPFLPALHRLLREQIINYRFEITKDFDPAWQLDLYLTRELAQIYCTNEIELDRLTRIMEKQ